MTDQKDNYIPDEDVPRRRPAIPNRPSDGGDEDVMVSIARRHASGLDIRQANRVRSPRRCPEPPVVNHTTPLPSTVLGTSETCQAESPLPDSTDICETGPKGTFYVRQAICKSQSEPARGKLVRSRFARVLIVYLVSMAVLAVALCFVTWLDGRRNEEFTQTKILVDGGGNPPKTEDPKAETPGRRNTVIIVNR